MRNPRGIGTADFYNLALDLYGDNRVAVLSNTIDCDEFEQFAKHIEKTDRVLIAGAGMGAQLAYFGAVVGPNQIVGYEANLKHAQMIKENVRVWGQPVNIKAGALYINEDGVTFNKVSHPDPSFVGGSSVMYTPSHPKLTSNQITKESVPSFDAKRELQKHNINAILLDVEGAELEILPHIDLSKIRLIVVEVHADVVKTEEIKNLLTENGLVIISHHNIPPNDLHILTAKRGKVEDIKPEVVPYTEYIDDGIITIVDEV